MARDGAYDLQFLESSENVKSVIFNTFGRKPNTEISRGIAVYIQQGRMFFESASEAPMEIRPLQLYYGIMAFAKAIITCRGFRAPSTLSQKHGLHDMTSQKAKLSELKVKIGTSGTFQEFNDAICELEGIDYFENAMSRRHILKTACSTQIAKAEITLKEILSRTTGLQEIFKITFREEAQVLPFSLFNHGTPIDLTDLRIDTPQIFDDGDSLRKIIEDVRKKYPVLRRWCFSYAEKAWDNTIILFKNVQPPENELKPESLTIIENGRRVTTGYAQKDTYIDFRELLDPTCCGLTQSNPFFSVKFNDVFISDASLQYAGIFLLGSLVRYQPQIWIHSISRFANEERPADDQALALIEQFMNTVQKTFPNLVVQLLTQP